MKQTDFLILTDHRGHSDQNSLYALVRTLAADMLETMYDAHGVGLAAPQVGVSLQLAIVDVSHDEECISYLRVNGEDASLAEICPLTFINPELELLGAKDTDIEGCLSFPDLRGDITRPFEVRATLTTLDGQTLIVDGGITIREPS